MSVKDKIEKFNYREALGKIKGVATNPYVIAGTAIVLVGMAAASTPEQNTFVPAFLWDNATRSMVLTDKLMPYSKLIVDSYLQQNGSIGWNLAFNCPYHY